MIMIMIMMMDNQHHDDAAASARHGGRSAVPRTQNLERWRGHGPGCGALDRPGFPFKFTVRVTMTEPESQTSNSESKIFKFQLWVTVAATLHLHLQVAQVTLGNIELNITKYVIEEYWTQYYPILHVILGNID
jgi:hypothetical protein